MTDTIAEKIVHLYERRHHSISGIGRLLNLSPGKVKDILVSEGVRIRKRSDYAVTGAAVAGGKQVADGRICRERDRLYINRIWAANPMGFGGVWSLKPGGCLHGRRPE